MATDVNLDGKLDLAVSFNNLLANQSGTVVMTGNVDGTFQLPPSTDFHSFGSMSTADFNGDGKRDLVILSGGTANLFLGNGDGTFGSPSNFAVGTGPWSVLAADLNLDKAPDLMVTNSADNTVSVLLNSGTEFSLSASPFSPARIGAGQSASSTLSLSLLNSFNNPIALSCSVQPAQAGSPTCSINPSSAVFDSAGPATAQLTVTAGALATSTRVLLNARFLPLLALAFLPIAGLSLIGKRAYFKESSQLNGFHCALCDYDLCRSAVNLELRRRWDDDAGQKLLDRCNWQIRISAALRNVDAVSSISEGRS